MRRHLPSRLSAVSQPRLCATCSVRSRAKSWSRRASLGSQGRQMTRKSRWALDDHGILKGKNGTCAPLAREALRSLQDSEAGITVLSPKYAHSLWLLAAGDDEDVFYHRVTGPRPPLFRSGANTVPACEHTQCRAYNVVAKIPAI